MKKAAKKLLFLACFGGVAFLAGKLAKKAEVQEKLFALLGEDTYLAVLDKLRLGGDLIMWPVDFVRALLP
ncbi:MAG: hypothetical protein J5927_01360 [Oscillospiraceae bacterium]|nr:hypothetical protein [Oscillospiraceae bacterium]